MFWSAKKGGGEAHPPVAAGIGPAQLPVALDAGLFRHYLERVTAEAQAWGGIEAYLEALAAKQGRIVQSLSEARSGLSPRFSLSAVEALLACVFTARRRLFPALAALGEARLGQAVQWLLQPSVPLAQRLQDFVDAMPGTAGLGREQMRQAAKVRRAAWDFAAELLHFSDPERYPLMARWVWDQATQSGALREFVRGSDAMPELPLVNAPETFESARAWLAEQLRGEGVYRDLHFWADLVQAQAYVTYMRSVAEGSLGGDFGRGAQPHEQLRKLLGIDAAPATGRSRVRKEHKEPSAAQAG